MVAKKWGRCVPSERERRLLPLAACVAAVLFVASCSSPPAPRPAPSEASAPPSPQATTGPEPTTAPTAPAADRQFDTVIAEIRSVVDETMNDEWTTQIVDDSRPDEVCAGRPHVNVAVPSVGSGAVRSLAEGAVISIVSRRYGSDGAASEALEYVAITSTTDCNPLAVTEGYEDFFVADSVDETQLAIVDEAQAWASYRRSTSNPSDVPVVAYSAIYRAGPLLATIHGRVEVGEDEDPDDAVLRARQLQATVMPGVVGVLKAAQ